MEAGLYFPVYCRSFHGVTQFFHFGLYPVLSPYSSYVCITNIYLRLCELSGQQSQRRKTEARVQAANRKKRKHDKSPLVTRSLVDVIPKTTRPGSPTPVSYDTGRRSTSPSIGPGSIHVNLDLDITEIQKEFEISIDELSGSADIGLGRTECKQKTNGVVK